jgi:hypothetical protein
MNWRVRRWLATHWPLAQLADWVLEVRTELQVADLAERLSAVRWVVTEPGVHDEDPWVGRLAAWGVSEDDLREPLPMRRELERVRSILDGVSPSDLPRGR